MLFYNRARKILLQEYIQNNEYPAELDNVVADMYHLLMLKKPQNSFEAMAYLSDFKDKALEILVQHIKNTYDYIAKNYLLNVIAISFSSFLIGLGVYVILAYYTPVPPPRFTIWQAFLMAFLWALLYNVFDMIALVLYKCNYSLFNDIAHALWFQLQHSIIAVYQMSSNIQFGEDNDTANDA